MCSGSMKIWWFLPILLESAWIQLPPSHNIISKIIPRGTNILIHFRCSSNENAKLTKIRRVRVVQFQIMEKVLKILSDPLSEYKNKQQVVHDVSQYLKNAELELKHPEIRREFAHAVSIDMDRSISLVLTQLRYCKVVAVLRGGHPERLFNRAIELSRMDGCGAIEIALDCKGSFEVLSELVKVLPTSCMVGAATVTSIAQAQMAIDCGARFVTSPFMVDGLVETCKRSGVLAIPGGFTPLEMSRIIASGAHAMKLFPACALTPAGLRQVLSVGPFRGAAVMASGGIAPSATRDWLAAGAFAVGIGTQLVGEDTRLDHPPSGAVSPEEAHWRTAGRQRAAALFRDFVSG